jgi:hypothetical protein
MLTVDPVEPFNLSIIIYIYTFFAAISCIKDIGGHFWQEIGGAHGQELSGVL